MMEQYYNTQPTTGSVFAPLMAAGHHEHRRRQLDQDGDITPPSPPSSTSPPSHHQHQRSSSIARPVSLIGPVDRVTRRVEEIGNFAAGLYRKQYSIDGILGKLENYHSEVQSPSQTRSPLSSSCGGSSPVPVDVSTKGS